MSVISIKMLSSSDHKSEFLSDDKILYSYRLGPKPQNKNKKNNLKEIIVIFDSDEELPEVDTLLSRISKKRKIISIPRLSVKIPASNDDYSFIYNNKTYQLKKCEIEKKIKCFKKRFKTKKFSNMLSDLFKNFKEKSFFIAFQKRKIRERKNLNVLYERINDFIPGYYGNKGYKIIYEHNLSFGIDNIEFNRDKYDLINEVLIPEISVYLIMNDLSVDYELAIKIRKHSAEYGSTYFTDDEDKTYGSSKFDAFMESYKIKTPINID